jgi:GTP cyclohydrolase I
MEKRIKKAIIRKWKGKEVIIVQETEHYCLVTWNTPNPNRKLFSVKIDEIEK